MKASDIMTREVISVSPDATVQDAVALMLKHRVSGLPVLTADGTLYGMLTEGDLLRRKEAGTQPQGRRWIAFLLDPARLAADYAQVQARTVRDVMTQLVVTVDRDAPLDEVVQKMQTYHVKRLPVLEDERVVGIVSRADVIGALGAGPAERADMSDSDKAIHRMLSRALKELPARRHRPRFAVSGGVVDLYWFGDASAQERLAARTAAEELAGVSKVREHLLEE